MTSILYYDSTTKELAIGPWGMATSANMIYTKFGSTVGFFHNDVDWAMNQIVFEPTTTKATTYDNIPNWSSWNGTRPATYDVDKNEDFISVSPYHTLANVKKGCGDICKLVGYTAAEVSAWTEEDFPTARPYRLPKTREYNAFVGYNGTAVTDQNISTSYVTFSGSGATRIGTFASGNVLPAMGSRRSDGSPTYWGLRGFYWSATPGSSTLGYLLRFYSGEINPSYLSNVDAGRPIRCVRQ